MKFKLKWTENSLLEIRMGSYAMFGARRFYDFYNCYLTPKEAKDLQQKISARLAGKKQKV